MLVLEGVHASFEVGSNGRGLRGIDLRVPPGELAALLGPNGSGKSTLLACVAGTHPVTQGCVSIAGRDLGRRPAHERARLVYVLSQNDGIGLPVHMTIGEVLALWHLRFSPPWRWMCSWRRAPILRETLSNYLPHLSERMDDQVLSLSGGERQLLSLACLELASEDPGSGAQALLMDEHVAALDPMLARLVMSRCQHIVRRRHLSGLFVAHSIDLVFAFADTLYVLQDGRIEPCGQVATLRDRRPASINPWLLQVINGSSKVVSPHTEPIREVTDAGGS